MRTITQIARACFPGTVKGAGIHCFFNICAEVSLSDKMDFTISDTALYVFRFSVVVIRFRPINHNDDAQMTNMILVTNIMNQWIIQDHSGAAYGCQVKSVLFIQPVGCITSVWIRKKHQNRN